MPRIFISYRRTDSIAYAGRLYDHLRQHFGPDKVFMDIDGIAPGEDFVKVLEARVAGSDVVIALIGPTWLNASNAAGRRIDQDSDFVRYELAAAITQGKRLIPVLVAGARMPDASELPSVLGPLARCQAQVIDDTRFAYDLDTLVRSIERRPSLLTQFAQLANSERLRKWRQGSAAGVALLMLFFGWVQLFDMFGIDTHLESYTMALGDLVADLPVSERVVIVSFDERSELRLGSFGPAWRGEHARVVDRLVDAGAGVIAFDLFFEKPGSDDALLIAAIARAREHGTQVFIGVRQLRAGQAVVIPGLREVANGLGLLCIGGRVGYASVAPLAIVKRSDPAKASGAATAGAAVGSGDRFLALGMLAAGAETLVIDAPRRQLTVADTRGQTVWQGPLEPLSLAVEASGEMANACPLLAAGDQVAEGMIRLAAPGAWRNPLRRYDYEQLAAPAAGTRPGDLKGKIVLIGDGRAGKDEFQVLYGFHREWQQGVELHANVVNNLIQEVEVRRLDQTWQFLLMVLLAATGGWLRLWRPTMPARLRRLLMCAVALVYLGLTLLAYSSYGVLLNTAYHLGSFFLAYLLLGRLALRCGWSSQQPGISR